MSETYGHRPPSVPPGESPEVEVWDLYYYYQVGGGPKTPPVTKLEVIPPATHETEQKPEKAEEIPKLHIYYALPIYYAEPRPTAPQQRPPQQRAAQAAPRNNPNLAARRDEQVSAAGFLAIVACVYALGVGIEAIGDTQNYIPYNPPKTEWYDPFSYVSAPLVKWYEQYKYNQQYGR